MKLPILILVLTTSLTLAQINPDTTPTRSGFVFSVPQGSEDNVPNLETRYHYPSPYMPEPEKDLDHYLAELLESLQWFVADSNARPPRYTVMKLQERQERTEKAKELAAKSQTYLGARL